MTVACCGDNSWQTLSLHTNVVLAYQDNAANLAQAHLPVELTASTLTKAATHKIPPRPHVTAES